MKSQTMGIRFSGWYSKALARPEASNTRSAGAPILFKRFRCGPNTAARVIGTKDTLSANPLLARFSGYYRGSL